MRNWESCWGDSLWVGGIREGGLQVCLRQEDEEKAYDRVYWEQVSQNNTFFWVQVSFTPCLSYKPLTCLWLAWLYVQVLPPLFCLLLFFLSSLFVSVCHTFLSVTITVLESAEDSQHWLSALALETSWLAVWFLLVFQMGNQQLTEMLACCSWLWRSEWVTSALCCVSQTVHTDLILPYFPLSKILLCHFSVVQLKAKRVFSGTFWLMYAKILVLYQVLDLK